MDGQQTNGNGNWSNGNGSNGNGKSAASVANSVTAILLTRAMTMIGLPVIGCALWAIASMISSDHDTLTRIDATMAMQTRTLEGYDQRIRTIEEAHKRGVP